MGLYRDYIYLCNRDCKGVFEDVSFFVPGVLFFLALSSLLCATLCIGQFYSRCPFFCFHVHSGAHVTVFLTKDSNRLQQLDLTGLAFRSLKGLDAANNFLEEVSCVE